MLRKLALPEFVTRAYQTTTFVAGSVAQGFCTKLELGVLPLTDTSFWQSISAAITIATALVVAETAAPLARMPPH
jgi:hypothetical protein